MNVPADAPVALPLTTTGVGTAEQDTASVKPVGGTLFLVDAGVDVNYLATDDGYFYVNGDYLSFTAHIGFSGTASAVEYIITNDDLQSSTSTYTPTVTKPTPPTAAPLSSTHPVNPYFQYADTGSITGNIAAAYLLSGGAQVSSLHVPGEGTYYIDGNDGVEASFQGEGCFVGTVTTVAYRVIDQYDQSADSTYTAHLTTPSPPTVSPLTSTGLLQAEQTVTAPQPYCVGSTKLLDSGGQPVTVLTRSDGTYTVDPATGIITFDPAAGYHGTGSAVNYRVTDEFGQHQDSTYRATVTLPAPPTVAELTSTGVGPAAQHVTAAVPVGGNAKLLDGANPVTSLTVAGQGSYAINATSGVITFTPEPDYLGTATPVSYKVTDSYGQSSTSIYTPTVTEPEAPNPPALTSTGIGTAVQSRTVSIPPAGAVTLLNGATPVTTLTVAGQGTYVLDSGTGLMRFTPVIGYLGTATSANYAVTDSYGQTGSSTYTPTVTIPAPPTAAPLTSTGAAGATQQGRITIPPGGVVTLLDGTTAVATVTIAGQGTYTLDAVSGVITFTPLAGFSGHPTPVTYEVSDAYGRTVGSTYSPVVTAAAATTTAPPPTTSPAAPSSTTPSPTTPSSAAAATVTSTVASTPTATSLPNTGSDVAELTQIALLLVVIGVALTAAGYYRRRPRSDRHR